LSLARRHRCAVSIATLACAMSLGSVAMAADPDMPPPGASAREPSPSGPRVALRSGVAVPFGSAFNASGALSDTITGYVPVRLDVGYRIARHFYVGVDAQLAVLLPNNCPPGASCTGTNVRFGGMLAVHVLPGSVIDPWVGLGMGYERLNVSRTVDGTTGEISASGVELLNFDLGMDLRPTRELRIGPVISSTFTRYTRVAVNGDSTTDFDPSLHAWVLLGFRGAFDL
jgi:hypothetical protein